jgi:hypothetical protein
MNRTFTVNGIAYNFVDLALKPEFLANFGDG